MHCTIETEAYGPVILEEWLEDYRRFSRYTTDEQKYGFDSIWVCNECSYIEDECECGEPRCH